MPISNPGGGGGGEDNGGGGGAPTPSGTIVAFGGASAPDTWALCDGSAIDRGIYAALFGVIGTTYGPGDGSTTFNLPAMGGLVPMGAADGVVALGQNIGEATHTLGASELPTVDPHTHTQPTHTHTISATGYVSVSTQSSDVNVLANTSGTVTTDPAGDDLTGSAGGFGSGSAHNNTQPSLGVNYIIKL